MTDLSRLTEALSRRFEAGHVMPVVLADDAAQEFIEQEIAPLLAEREAKAWATGRQRGYHEGNCIPARRCVCSLALMVTEFSAVSGEPNG